MMARRSGRSRSGAIAPATHELLDALTSLRGCAQTLLLADSSSLRFDVRSSLASIVIQQSDKLEWLIRALAVPRSAPLLLDLIDTEVLVKRACEFAGARLSSDGSGILVPGDDSLLTLGVEAVLLALSHGGRPVTVSLRNGSVLRLRSDARDLAYPAIAWKLDLARTIFRQMDVGLRVRESARGSTAVVRFPTSFPDFPDEDQTSV